MYKDWLFNSDINEALKVLLKGSDRCNDESFEIIANKVKDKLGCFGFSSFFDFDLKDISIWLGNYVGSFFDNVIVTGMGLGFRYKPQLKYSIFTWSGGTHHQLLFAVMHEGKLTHLFYFNSLGASNENDFKLIKQELKRRNDAHDVKVFRNNNKPQRDGYTCGHQCIIAAYTLVHFIEEIRQECNKNDSVGFCTRVTEKLQDMQTNSERYFKIFNTKDAESVCELVDNALRLSNGFADKKATSSKKDKNEKPSEWRFLYSKKGREIFSEEETRKNRKNNPAKAGSTAFFSVLPKSESGSNSMIVESAEGQSLTNAEKDPLMPGGEKKKNEDENENKCPCCTIS